MKPDFLPFTSVPSLCGASPSKVLVPITEFQTQAMERENLSLSSWSQRTDRSVKTVCCDRIFLVLEFFLRATFYAIFFSSRFATAVSRSRVESKPEWMAAGGSVGMRGNNRRPAPRGVSRILRIRCGNWLLPAAALAAFRRPAGCVIVWGLKSAVMQF